MITQLALTCFTNILRYISKYNLRNMSAQIFLSIFTLSKNSLHPVSYEILRFLYSSRTFRKQCCSNIGPELEYILAST